MINQIVRKKIRNLLHKKLMKYISYIASHIIYKNKKMLRRKRIKKVLVISLDYIGDYVARTIPIIFIIKTYFPNASISIMVGSWTNELVASNPFVEKVIVYNAAWLDRTNKKWNLKRKLKVLINVWKEDFDLALEVRGSIGTAFLGLFGFSKHRLDLHGFSIMSIMNEINKKVSSENGFFLIQDQSSDTILNGLQNKKRSFISTKEKDKVSIKKLLTNERIDFSKKIISIHPGAYSKVKQWENKKWAEVCDILLEQYNVEILICGSIRDTRLVQDIARRMKNRTINLAGKTTLMELSALIEMSDLCIAIDSGPMHIASLFNTPLIALFGPNDPKNCRRFLTNKCRVLYKNLPCVKFCIENVMDCNGECMKTIQCEDVLKEVKIIAEEHGFFHSALDMIW
jgi:lipopolysaccharide heptosyltransferase II